MRNFDAAVWFRRAQSITVGVIMATIGALLRKAESAATGMVMRTIERLVPAKRPSTRPKVISRAPVSRSAADTIKRAPIAATTGLANPEKVSTGLRMPVAPKQMSVPINTRSGAASSRTMAVSASATRASVKMICQSIGAGRYPIHVLRSPCLAAALIGGVSIRVAF